MEQLIFNRPWATTTENRPPIELSTAGLIRRPPYRKSIFPYECCIPPHEAPLVSHYPLLPPKQPFPATLAEAEHISHRLPPTILPIKKVKNFCFLRSPPQMRMRPMNYNFSREDVDAVLYGYIADRCDRQKSSHSLSGLCTNPVKETKSEENIILPKSLTTKTLHAGPVSHKGIFATEVIKKGKIYGPFKGNTIRPNCISKIDLEHSWEVFKDGHLLHYICSVTSNRCWMRLVNSARYAKEQNLAVVQRGDQIFYEVTEDIKPGIELLVWYGDTYVDYMGFPLATRTNRTKISPRKQQSSPIERPVEKESEAKAGSYPCSRCGKIFSYEYYREKHLKYTRCVDKGDRKFPCHLCQRSFEKKDRLRIHILHVHQKYRPHLCKICGKRFSQSSSLNKHSRVHTGERPYSCPHCPKSFTASSILRTHLRQHNGERPFKCKFCGKAFASHAAHDSHVRRTHEKLKIFSCGVCSKTFSMEFELKFHLSTHTHHELAGNFANDDTQRSRSYSEESESSLVIDIENEELVT